MNTLHRITPSERVEGQPTPGMARERAIQTEGMWAGYVTTEAGMLSGWHHHGTYESAIYVISGALRMEFGSGDDERFDAGPGDFVYVPKQVVHREGNPASEPATVVVFRAGEGEPVFNVDGPE